MTAASGQLAELRIDPGELAGAVTGRLERWQAEDAGARLWRRDSTLWSAAPVAELEDRLGWLELPASMRPRLGELEALGAAAVADGLDAVVLLGMGGSSLGAEMLAAVLGGGARLRIADSTHPDAVAALAAALDPAAALFVVSSKSGTTVETDSLRRYFWSWLEERGIEPAARFVAITDPGTALAELASEEGFRGLVEAPADIGGRYSVLGPFGLVPVALAGAELAGLLDSALAMAERCGPRTAAAEHPGLRLAALLGEAALAGRPHLRLAAPASLAPFVPWVEQLVAESTGKDGRGILPLPAEPAAAAGHGLLVELGEGGSAGAPPRAVIGVGQAAELGGEIFRWQIATAMASAVLGVHPFNQPDVQLAKELAQRAARGEAAAEAPPPQPSATADLAGWLRGVAADGYLAVQAFVAPSAAADAGLERLRRALARRAGVATTAGYGPRFLHSTGQLHKGGPASGRFLQLVDRPQGEVEIPGADLTFGRLLRAQADGDAAALARRGRRLLRVDLGAAPEMALGELAARVESG